MAHTSATETPPMTAAMTFVSTSIPAAAKGMSAVLSSGGNGVYQPPSARGTSSSQE